ncbi:MAG: 30S ribosomal protein S17 [Candidatus Wallbacteria bacterium]|nr:30S ribosomal protein S17 [Candidatus Wallbacteria bacterium]
MSETTRNIRKTRVGKVLSRKMEKTCVVVVERSYQHTLYKKTLRTTKKYKVHDEKNETNPGDKVLIMETRPLSREKRWRLVKILEAAR